MESHARAQPSLADVDVLAAEGVAALRAKKRSTTQKLSLANPGDINREVVVAVAAAVPPDLIAMKIRALLDTTRRLKDGTEIPDVRAMEAGIKLALAYTVGLPTQRQEIVQVNLDADSAVGLKERLQHSPALRKTLAGLLAEVETSSVEQSATTTSSGADA